MDLHYCIQNKRESEVAQSCPTLCSPMDCSPPGSSVHGILQAGTLEWAAISIPQALLQLYLTDFCFLIHSIQNLL